MESILEFLIGLCFVIPTAAMVAADLATQLGLHGFWDHLRELHGN